MLSRCGNILNVQYLIIFIQELGSWRFPLVLQTLYVSYKHKHSGEGKQELSHYILQPFSGGNGP